MKIEAEIFGACSQEFEKYRPSYPTEGIEWLVARAELSRDSVIVDVGAGTGKLSRLLAPSVKKVTALEAVAGMMRQGQKECAKFRNIEYVRGEAEAMPLADHSCDAVFSGQAFHWFDYKRAVPEFHRVLKNKGYLSLLWNNRDYRKVAWLGELERLVTKYNPHHTPDYRQRPWPDLVSEFGTFKFLERMEYFQQSWVSEKEVKGLLHSFSYIQVIPMEKRKKFFVEVDELLKEIIKFSDAKKLLLRYQTECYLFVHIP